MATIRDVAKEANVSVATVSYVLNKNKNVSQELTDNVLKAVDKLDYKYNAIASSLRNNRTKTVGVVLQNIRNVFFVHLLAGLEEYINANNYRLIFFDTGYDINKERECISTLRSMRVEGVILYSCVGAKEKNEYIQFLVKQLTENEIPTVLLDRDACGKLGSVLIENERGGYEATKHLIDFGRRNILHISGIEDWENSLARQQGYTNAMRSHDLEDHIIIHSGRFQPVRGYEITRSLIEKGIKLDGIFAANDQMAIGAMKAILEFGIKIPDDIGVIGYDNLFFTTFVDPALSTMNVPTHSIGRTAAEMLINIIENSDSAEKSAIFNTNLIVRQSTDVRAERGWVLYGW